jgi:hypothetical protein
MNRKLCYLCLLALAGSAGIPFAKKVSGRYPRSWPPANHALQKPKPKALGTGLPARSEVPLAFEPNVGQADPRAQFVARSKGMTALLTREGIVLSFPRHTRAGADVSKDHVGNVSRLALAVGLTSGEQFKWAGEGKLRGESNYFIGNDAKNWRTHVPHFVRAEATVGNRGLAMNAYGSDDGFEYDLRIPPGMDVTRLRLALSGARNVRLNREGDLLMSVGGRELRMKRPDIFQEVPDTIQESLPADKKVDLERLPEKSQISEPRKKAEAPGGPKKRNRRSTPKSAAKARRHRARNKIRGTTARPPAMRRPHTNTPRTNKRPPRTDKPTGTSSEGGRKKRVEGGYVLYADGTVGFRVGQYDASATLVLDPSVSIVYSTFLGGTGNDAANSLAMDSSGNLYVGGTTTSAATFPEAGSTLQGPTGGASDYFIAKIDPSVNGPDSLVYLTFLGGSGAETGGLVAVDTEGNVAIAGTTTSTDFPVTDGSKLTSGANDVTVTEIGPTGSTLIYSTIFGGSGSEAAEGTGGIAVDGSGNILVSSDTNSTDLPVTADAFQRTYGGGISDGYLVIFQPDATPHLKYCTYLGIDAEVAVGGVAVDSSGNAYLAGFTTNPGTTFPAKNAFQTAYAGDPDDAYLMKISPEGKGAADLIYATLLGGENLDEAYGVAVDTAAPPHAYVTGTTQSTGFPINGAVAAYQASLHTNATANAFLTVVSQDVSTGMTSLAYSTYLGGSETDSGQALAVTAANSVYVAGATTSFDFPWLNNLQPYNGDGDAFVAKLDPTSAGTASLIYSTPLGGTAPPGGLVNAEAAGVAVTISNGSAEVYLAGQTTAADFPASGSAGNGFQMICGSCQESPPASNAFFVAIEESATPLPSIYFSSANLNFGPQFIGAANVPPQSALVYNGGSTPLQITSMGIAGPNSSDFSLINPQFCLAEPISPGSSCSFGVGYVPSMVGPEAATVTFADNAPGNPQALEIIGIGDGPLATLSATNLNFGNEPEGSTTSYQTISLMNTGNDTLTLTQASLGGPNANLFTPSLGNTCKANLALNVGANCTFAVEFAPNTTGTFNAEIDFFDNSGSVQGAEQIVALTGVGTTAAPIANLLPTSILFGSVAVSSTAATQTVTLTNTGSAGLNLTGIALTGTNPADFVITPTGGIPCPVTSGTVVSGANCTIGVAFAPQTTGSKSASLNFADDAAGTPQIVQLSGTAVAPSIQISPGSLTYAGQSEGSTSAAQTITLTDTGSFALAINTITLTGTNPGDFSQTNNCPPSLGPGASCLLNVFFSPTAQGSRTANVSIADNAAGSPQAIPLIGTGTQAGISLPSSVAFGSQLVGVSGSPVPVIVTNNGSGTLLVSAASIGGANAGDFTIGTNSCVGPNVMIAPAGTCTVQITFTPACATAVAARTATLTLTDNAPANPQTVPLSGTATGEFCFDPPTTGGTSVTVSAGQTATFSLDVVSANDFSGTVALTCAGAPSSCLFITTPGGTGAATANVTIGPGAPAQFQVSVPTTAADARLGPENRFEIPRPNSQMGRIGSVILAAALLAIVLAIPGNGGNRRKVWRIVRTGALIGAFTIGYCACSAGGGGGGTIQPTTKTYPLTVTGAAGSATQTINLTLIVD